MKSSKAESDNKRSSRAAKQPPSEESPPKLRTQSSPSRSPARVRKTSPGPKASRRSPVRKSPSRKSPSRKSPSRKSPSRKSPSRKSPSRKSPSRKSPSRKSPSRNAKEIDEPSKSPSRRPAIKSELPKSSIEQNSLKLEFTRPSRSRPTENLIKEYSSIIQESVDTINGVDSLINYREGLHERKPKAVEEPASAPFGSRRSIRLKESTENFQKLYNLAQSTKLPKSDLMFENFSDGENLSEDEMLPQKDKSATRNLVTPLLDTSESSKAQVDCGGSLGALMKTIFSPLLILGVNMACDKTHCSFTSMPDLNQYKKLDSWISMKAATVYLSFILFQSLISLIPYFGKKIITEDNITYVANGVFTLFVTLIVMAGLELLDIPIFHIIYDEYFRIIIISMIFGFFVTVLLYIRSRKLPSEKRNPAGNTGYIFYDMFMGGEVNSLIFGKFFVKLILLRASLVACIVMNVVALYHGLNVKNFPILSPETALEIETYNDIARSLSISPTLVVVAFMQIGYLFYAIYNEDILSTTFEFQYEGTGLLTCFGYSIYPFTTMLITKYVYEHNVILPNLVLVLVVAIYLTGFYIYDASNVQKSSFRANPMDPKLAHLDSIPTFHGKRLLVSGWWGFVRHPNYLGDIILHLSWGVAAASVPPIIFIIITVFLLMHRVSRDGERCHKRYGTAWDRYCRRVPYSLVPRVY